VELSPLGTSATEWPIVPAQGDCGDGEFVGMKIHKETEVLGGNLHQRHFAHHKYHLPDLGSKLGRSGGKPSTNCLSYGSASIREI
jgi:hypothetical protein